MAKKINRSDTLSVHHLYDPFRGRRSGVHAGKQKGPNKADDKSFDPKKNKWSAIDPLTVFGIEDIDTALVVLANGGDAFITRSEPLLSGLACYRCSANDKNKDATSHIANPTDPGPVDRAALKAAPMHALVVDADDWPNIKGFDPRTDGVAAWKWMLSVLGREFTNVKVSAWWSASCCVRATYEPATLSAKFWIWGDTPLDPDAAGELLARLDLRVKAYFQAAYDDVADSSTYQDPSLIFDPTKKLVDPRVALVSQRIYIAAPRFVGGAVDPLPGDLRHQLLPGKRALNIGDLLASLPTLDTARKTRTKPTSGKPSANRMPKSRSLTVNVGGQAIPLAAASREIASMRAACHAAISGTDEEYLAACEQLFHRRVALEMLSLAAHRGGLSEGNRNNSALMISSAVVASLPVITTVAQARQQVRSTLRLVVDEAWIDAEWQGKGDQSVMDGLEAAQRGEKGSHGMSDPRYTYFKKSLLKFWQPTQDEVDELDMMSLLSEAQRSKSRRAKAKAAKAAIETPKQAAKRIQAGQVKLLRDGGKTWQQIELEMGVPYTTVRRLFDVVNAAPDVEVPAAAAEMPTPVADTTINTTTQGEPTMARHNDDFSDAQLARYDSEVKLEMAEDARIAKAFHAWFATTPEGKEEGRWDNVVYWQWQAAGSPEKIALYKHPARPALLVKFRAEWLAHRAVGTPMSMVVPPPPARARFGRRAA